MFFQLYYSTRQVAVCRILSKRDDRHGIGQTLAKFTHCRSSTSFIEEDARLLQIYVLAYYWDMMMMTCKHCLEGSTRDDHHLLLLILLLWERRGQYYSDAVRGRRNHRTLRWDFSISIQSRFAIRSKRADFPNILPRFKWCGCSADIVHRLQDHHQKQHLQWPPINTVFLNSLAKPRWSLCDWPLRQRLWSRSTDSVASDGLSIEYIQCKSGPIRNNI